MELKRCTKCGEEKPLDMFWTRSNGYVIAQCKPCRKIVLQQYRTQNREKVRAATNNDRKNNPHKYLTKERKYRERNQSTARAKTKKWALQNREYLLSKLKKNRETLDDNYIKTTLRMSDAPPDLIELKRQQLMIHRITNQLKKEIKNVE